jgi:NADH-ubiquinone oxidoreductase chain 6
MLFLTYLSLGFENLILTLLSLMAIFFGTCVIIAKNPVVSVLFLIGLFSLIAFYLLSIGLSFIGLSYLLVYIGAVSILFLFIVMLINVRIADLLIENLNGIPLAILGGCFLLCFLSVALYEENIMLTFYIFSSLSENIGLYSSNH